MGGQEVAHRKALELTRLIEISQIKQEQIEKRACARSKAVYFGCHHVTEHGSILVELGADGDCMSSERDER